MEENLAVLIDYENIGTQDHIRALMDEASGMGRTVVKLAFGDWSKVNNQNQVALQSLGIELIHHAVTTAGKNASDIRLTVEAVKLMYSSPVEISTFLIVSSDSDFFPLVNFLRSNGKSVIVAGRRDVSSDLLVRSCDRYIDLVELVRSDEPLTSSDDEPAQPAAPAEPPEVPKASATSPQARRPLPKVSSSASSVDNERVDVETRGLVRRAIRSSRDNEGIVKDAKLMETIRRIDPGFDFRRNGYHSFSTFLDAIPGIQVQRRGANDMDVKII